MAAELQDIDQEMHLEVQEDSFGIDKSCFENVDYTHYFEITDRHIKIEIDDNKEHLENEYLHSQIDNPHKNMDTGLTLQNVNQRTTGQEQNFEKDKPLFDNVDYAQSFESTDSHFQDICNLHNNMEPEIRTIKQELYTNKKRLTSSHPNFENSDNIYVFENTDSYSQDKDHVEYGMYVETMDIKEQTKQYREQISELENKNCSDDEKYDPIVDNTNLTNKRSDFKTVKTEINDLEHGNFNLENSNIGVENSYAKIEFIDLKSEEGPNIYEKTDLKFENSNSFNYRCNAEISRNEFKIEDSSSNIGNMPVEIECNGVYMDNADLNIDAVDFIKKRTDLRTGLLDTSVGNNRARVNMDMQPIVLLKRLPDTVFNNKYQVYLTTQTKFNHLKSLTYLRKHMTSHSSDQPHQCNVCGKEFKRMNVLRQHMVVHSMDRPHQCNVCGKEFKRMNVLRQHMVVHSTDRPHQCNTCGKGFKRMTVLRQHMVVHSTDRPHQCNTCGKGFKSLTYLRKHMTSHSSDRQHLCSMCGKEFKHAINLKQHMFSHNTEWPHQCNLCGKGFTALWALKQHMISHTSERPHQCNVCGKGFKRMTVLRQHMVVHSTDRPHQCNTCGKGFKSLTYLRKHMTSHSSDRQHLCSMCGKKFKHAINLKQHMITHSRERPHQCNVCGEGFKRMYALRQHIVVHSTDRPHQCNTCGKGFKTLKYLGEHMWYHSRQIAPQNDSK